MEIKYFRRKSQHFDKKSSAKMESRFQIENFGKNVLKSCEKLIEKSEIGEKQKFGA